AGVFRMNVLRFLIALAVGRTIRFALEGWMAVRYGEQAAEVFNHQYPKIGLGIAAAIVIVFLINKFLSRKRGEEITDANLSTAE
ncbi:MAG: hypothetical protein ACREEM_46895, partial [Blastocatellia bacterium]